MAFLSFHFPAIRSLAVPSVCLLICFLAYSSQYLFYHLEPGPLTAKEATWFNFLVAGIWWSYERACRVDPGRLPKVQASVGLGKELGADGEAGEHPQGTEATLSGGRGRWCKKCEDVKPPRAHHCRQCGRCIPKMDHHCPWTANCVSHTTFPYFLRFVYYICASLLLLLYHLSIRVYAIYTVRNLPSHLGPSISALVHLLILVLTTSVLLFVMLILLITATHSLLTNTTMIESWEIERHESLVEKARYLGGYVRGPNGRRIRIQRQEFPYDIGIWKNLVQGMGTSNILAWILPFGSGPGNESGWGRWEENGFEDEGVEWPPVDPDKLPRATPQSYFDRDQKPFTHGDDEDEIQAFKMRQQEDYKRWETRRSNNLDPKVGQRIRSTASAMNPDKDERKEYDGSGDHDGDGDDYQSEYEEGIDGQAGWTNSDGDRLRDYGVDEDAELILEDDDIPLGELLRRRRAVAKERD